MKPGILKAIFIVWIAVWLAFLARELFVKGAVRGYGVLLSRPLEGKRSYAYGDRFYEFLVYCKGRIPERGAYKLTGIDEGSIEKWRAVYYLYPRAEKEDAEYIIGYDGSRYTLKEKVK